MDKEKLLKELGEKIRNRRIELSISQKELGLRINKDQQAINRLETGGINPSYIQLLEVCIGLELTIDELLKKEIMDYYMLEHYEWLVKSLNFPPTRGFFVSFSVKIGDVDKCYPPSSNKTFAFCPTRNYKDFEQKNGKVISEIPEYIRFFDDSEIESICAVIPLHK